MANLKQVGDFVYEVRGNKTVVVASIDSFSAHEGQLKVYRKLRQYKKTGKYYDVIYKGKTYMGVEYEHMGVRELERCLK